MIGLYRHEVEEVEEVAEEDGWIAESAKEKEEEK
jgi:hypothetical protein